MRRVILKNNLYILLKKDKVIKLGWMGDREERRVGKGGEERDTYKNENVNIYLFHILFLKHYIRY
jgi:hypothetical protein